MKRILMKRIVITLCLSLLFAAAVPVGVANALDTYWQNPVSGDWSTSANWDAGEPNGFTGAFINNGGTVQITQIGEVARFLVLGGASGTSGSVYMSGGSLTLPISLSKHCRW